MQSEPQQVAKPDELPRVDMDATLVTTILEKSREGKITWDRVKNLYHAVTTGSVMDINLEVADILIFGRTWTLFTVFRMGEELLRLENTRSSFATLAGIPLSLSHKKVSDLLAYLEATRQNQVRTAVNELERL